MPDDAKVARFADIAERMDALKAELKTLTAEHEDLEAVLLLQFQESGQQSVSTAPHIATSERIARQPETTSEREAWDVLRDAGIIVVLSEHIPGRTVFLRSQLWAGAEKGEDGETDYASACEALELAGQSQFVHPTFHAGAVSAWVRDLPTDEETMMPILPDVLRGKLRVTRRWSLVIQRAAARKSRSGA